MSPSIRWRSIPRRHRRSTPVWAASLRRRRMVVHSGSIRTSALRANGSMLSQSIPLLRPRCTRAWSRRAPCTRAPTPGRTGRRRPTDCIPAASRPWRLLRRSRRRSTPGRSFGGVSKSTDGGSSWTLVNNGLTAVGIYASTLAVDPANADIVYVATLPTSRPDTDAKIFKSTSGAAQWRQVPITLPKGALITSFAIDPATPSTMYAAYVDSARRILAGYTKAATAARRGPPRKTCCPPDAASR